MGSHASLSHRARLAQGIKDNIRKPKIGGLFWWTIAIIILCVLVVASWFFSIFVFAHPEMPRAYKLLKRMDKLEPVKIFESNAPPRGKFRTPRQIYENYSRYNDFLLSEINAILKRDYLENYKRAERITYLKGEFVIHAVRKLTANDIFPVGMIVYAISADYPKTHIEYILPGNVDKRRSLDLFKVGTSLFAGARDAGPTDFSTPLHIQRMNEDELLFTVVPIIYKYKAADKLFLKMAPPETLNMDATWPITSTKEREDSLIMEAVPVTEEDLTKEAAAAE
jgi:hypothetical protein